jgi:aspartate racemase
MTSVCKRLEEAFYAERMRDKFGIEVIVPSPPSRQLVHNVIYRELCHAWFAMSPREVSGDHSRTSR